MYRISIGLLSITFAFLCATHTIAADQTVRVNHNDQAFVSTVTVPATNGRVTWANVLRGVARAQGYDDGTLKGTLPYGSFKVEGRMGRLFISGIHRTFGPGVRVRVEQPRSSRGEPTLVIDIDRQQLQAARRDVKSRIRKTVLPKDYDGREYGIIAHDTPANVSRRSQLVIFIHGLNAHPSTVRRISATAQQSGLATAEFHYPNDQAVDESALLLSTELKRWKREHPQQRIALVAHSMGGLVARAAIEDPSLDPGNVEKLIMVATPNQGCALAQFAFGLDVWEYMHKGNRDSKNCLIYSSIEDGLSEATEDLRPGSIFLTKLNRRQRNPHVKYSLFLGTGGPCTRQELNDVRSKIQGAGEYCSWARFFGSKLDPAIADLDEVVGGYGDGAVAVKRGRLAGVEDTQVMEFGHLGVLFDSEDEQVQKVYAEVLRRLLSDDAVVITGRGN